MSPTLTQAFPGLRTSRATHMRNQLPPIVDVVMIVADGFSLRKIPGFDGATPPAALQPPTSATFTDSRRLDEDIAAFEGWLIENDIRFRTFRTAVLIRGAKWSNTEF